MDINKKNMYIELNNLTKDFAEYIFYNINNKNDKGYIKVNLIILEKSTKYSTYLPEDFINIIYKKIDNFQVKDIIY